MAFWIPFFGALAGAFVGVVVVSLIGYYLNRPRKPPAAYRDFEEFHEDVQRGVNEMEHDEAYKNYLKQTQNF